MNTNLVPAKSTRTAVPVDDKAALTSTQIAVLNSLLLGKTVTDAAAAAGIGRRTIYNWLRQDFSFVAALNRSRQEIQKAIACRIEQIAADATECVAGAVRNGDVKTALEVLSCSGALAPAEIGSDDEVALYLDEKLRTENRERLRALEGLGLEELLSSMKLLPREK